ISENVIDALGLQTRSNVLALTFNAAPTITITSNVPSTDIGMNILITNSIVGGGTPPYTFTYNAVAPLVMTGNQVTSPSAGTYYISENVIDALGLQTRSNVLALTFNAAPTITITSNVPSTDIGMNILITNSIVGGGTPPYTFTYNAVAPLVMTGNQVTSPSAGTYYISENVIDALGLQTRSNVLALTFNAAPTITITSNVPSTDIGMNILITNSIVGGGTPPYTFTYNAVAPLVMTGNQVTSPSAGTYYISENVIDALGLQTRSNVLALTFNAAPTITITSNVPSTDIGMNILITNSIVGGGTPPYTFTYNAVAPLVMTGNQVTSPSAGTYYISENVIDALGLQTRSNVLALTFNAAPTITITSNVPSTDIGMNILITNSIVGGGTPPYTFTYNAVAPLVMTGNQVTSPSAGTYYISENVIDALGLQTRSNVLALTFNAAPTITITSNVPSTDIGMNILITNSIVSGGTPPYTFTYNAVAPLVMTGNQVTSPSAGTYYISENVIDALGLQTRSNVLALTFNAAPTITITSNVPSTDIGMNILITNSVVSGGTPPYTFTYNAVAPLVMTGNQVTSPSAGTYYISENVIDALGLQT